MDEKELACLQAVGRAVEGMTERERLEFVGRVAMYVANVGQGATAETDFKFEPVAASLKFESIAPPMSSVRAGRKST